MLQTACMSPELLGSHNMSEGEVCGYSPGQGSPLPGETASPKSCFQQSPSLPDSGLTELNVASPKIYQPPAAPCKPPGMPAAAESELSSDPPQKRYMGVRVKMPVRELLRKIRLSKGLEPPPSKEASSGKTVTKGSSGKTAEKRRAHPYTEKQPRQSKQSAGQTPKGLEDLDILVEVLQEDLSQSQLREEPGGFGQGFSRDPRSWGSEGEAAGPPGSSAGLGRESCLGDFQPIPRAQAPPAFHGEQGSAQRSGIFSRRDGKGSGWWVQDALHGSQRGFHTNSPSQEIFSRSSPSQEFFPRNSPSQEIFPRNSPSQEGFPRNSSSQEIFSRIYPSQEFFPRNSPSQEIFSRSFPSQEIFSRNSPSQEGFSRIYPSQEGFLGNSPSQQGFLRNSPSKEGFSRNSPYQEGFPRNSPSQEGFPRNSPSQEVFPRISPSQDTPALPSPAQMLPEAPDVETPPIPFSQQDLSALSFFQFQLHREENLLRNIPEEKLLAPDENGSRPLHKAVAQGRRALTFALAQRFASLNKIDEKDAEKRTALHLAAEKNQHLMVSDLISLGANVNEQDSSGRTPLHLCAENGYLRVLQVLKGCKDSGVRVEVDLPDHCGLTALHRAALAHSELVAQSHGTARDSSTGRFLRLRKEQILEGILCLLQMGARPQLQVLDSCPSPRGCPELQEDTELMGFLQSHRARAQDVPQQSCSLLGAPRGIPAPPAAQTSPELCSLPPSDLLDVLLKGFVWWEGEC